MSVQGMLNEIRKIGASLNAGEIRSTAARELRVGLAATSNEAYQVMERFLCSGHSGLGDEAAQSRAAQTLRHAGIDDSQACDVLLCESNPTLGPLPANGYRFDARDPAGTVAAIVAGNPELELALGRSFPQFRRAVSGKIIHRIAAENALFSLVSALPNVVPSALELPWAVGEFATDTAFLTMNQIRMALQLAAAHDRPIGYAEQKLQIAGIVGSAFGWRALARELAGKIPLGGGLIPKAAIAFAGTWVLGVGLERVNRSSPGLSRSEHREAWAAALAKGKAVARELVPSIARRRS
jgi:hypothetical protein